MITRGEIIRIDLGTNTCLVRIPIFETNGIGDQALFTATIAIPPGVHTGYQEGDIVFVSFCDNTLSLPVIIGKLYLGSAEELKARSQVGWVGCNELEVEPQGKAQLPVDGTIFTYRNGRQSNLKDLLDDVQNLKLVIGNLSSTMSILQNTLEKLIPG